MLTSFMLQTEVLSRVTSSPISSVRRISTGASNFTKLRSARQRRREHSQTRSTSCNWVNERSSSTSWTGRTTSAARRTKNGARRKSIWTLLRGRGRPRRGKRRTWRKQGRPELRRRPSERKNRGQVEQVSCPTRPESETRLGVT